MQTQSAEKTESVSVRVPASLARKLKQKAAAERRTLSNWLLLKLEKVVDEPN